MSAHNIVRRIALAALLVLLGCAKPQVYEAPELYWPLPPEKPRIKFVDVIVGSLDAEMRFQKIKKYIFGKPAESKFVKPFGVAARDGIMYVSDIGGVHVFDFTKGKYKVAGTSFLLNPAGLDVDDDGNIYVADLAKRSVTVINQAGEAAREIGMGEIDTPGGVAIDRQNLRLLVTDAKKHLIHVFSLEGELIGQIGQRGVEPGQFNIPYGIAVDHHGRIYVVDFGNFRVQILSEDGAPIKVFGSVGLRPGNFARPKGIALDSEGHIYVIDAAFGNFQIFDFEGRTLLAVGRPGKAIGEFTLPSDICIDNNDEIYVVDQVNKRVQIFQYLKES